MNGGGTNNSFYRVHTPCTREPGGSQGVGSPPPLNIGFFPGSTAGFIEAYAHTLKIAKTAIAKRPRIGDSSSDGHYRGKYGRLHVIECVLDSEQNTMEEVLKNAEAQAVDLVGARERSNVNQRQQLARSFFPEGCPHQEFKDFYKNSEHHLVPIRLTNMPLWLYFRSVSSSEKLVKL